MILFTFLQIIYDQYSLENWMNGEDASKWLLVSCEESDLVMMINLKSDCSDEYCLQTHLDLSQC